MFRDNDLLQNVMSKYAKLAESNPRKLRELLPAEEVWRLFIDGTVQRYGNIVTSKLKKQHVNILSSIADISVVGHGGEEVALRDALSEMGWDISEKAAKTITIRELFLLQRGWYGFEQTEPGYLQAMYSAFQDIFKIESKLSVDFIERLHDVAAKDVKNTQFDDDEENRRGELRQCSSMDFTLRKNNLSREGMKELINRVGSEKDESAIMLGVVFYDDDQSDEGVLRINKDSLRDIKKYIDQRNDEKAHGIRVQQNFPLAKYFLYVKDKKEFMGRLANGDRYSLLDNLAKSSEEISEYIYSLAFDRQHGVVCVSQQHGDAQAILRSQLNSMIAVFDAAMASASNPKEKINHIVRFIQDAIQLHPFGDCNCRVFGMLLLNHLLLQHGFPLAIMHEVNHFGAYSRDELVVDVIKGMQNTFDLIEQKQLFGLETQDVLRVLTKAGNDSLSYFQRCVDGELEDRVQQKQSKQLK